MTRLDFTADDLQGAGLIPHGTEVQAVLVKVENKENVTSNSGATYSAVRLSFQVDGGEYNGVYLSENCFYEHSTSPAAVRMGMEKLRGVQESLGLKRITEEVLVGEIGSAVGLVVGVQPARGDFDESNTIKKFLPPSAPAQDPPAATSW